jgi:asparagine synthase (glutamine-hydrolysing)
MCGITGFIQYGGESSEELARRCQRMADKIAHRGPDAEGVWVDPSYPIALGHRRLSIIDLSEAGAQPMVSSSGRYVLSFNGEVYNFSKLRREAGISAYPYQGHSDTEVVLAAAQHLGVEQAISRLEGMFAIALWDRQERCLWLARDSVGKKPLYCGWSGSSLLFGSEQPCASTRILTVSWIVMRWGNTCSTAGCHSHYLFTNTCANCRRATSFE